MFKLFKNYLSVLFGRGIGQGFTFLTFLYLARMLGPTNYGIIGFLSSYTSFFMLFAGLGIPFYGTRELALIDDPARKARFSGYWIRLNLILAIAAYLLFNISLWIMGVSQTTRHFGAVWGLRIIISGASCYWIFQAHEKMNIIGLRDFFKGLLFLVSVLLLIKSPNQIVASAWINILSVTAGEFILIILLFVGFLKFIPSLKARNKQKDLGFTRPVLRIGFTLFMVQIYYRVDILIIQAFRGSHHVGLYSAVYQVVFVCESVAVLYFSTILPRISSLWKRDKFELEKLLGFSLSIFTVFGVLIGILGTLFSGNIIKLVYGNSYIPAHKALIILSWSIALTYIALTPAYFLLGTQYQKECSHATTIAALTNLVLNFPLIIKYGITGAAMSTLISKLVELSYLYIRTRDKVKLSWGFRKIKKGWFFRF
ncbi:oligosaccharide flippase family protein [Candidatus Poribacteria bacterium]|nr:oligosaccharide flippase family protein [Candidatus Poribacteria bacterium]